MLQNKSRSKTTAPKHANKDASRSGGQAAVDTREADPNEDVSHMGQGGVDAREADPVRLFLATMTHRVFSCPIRRNKQPMHPNPRPRGSN